MIARNQTSPAPVESPAPSAPTSSGTATSNEVLAYELEHAHAAIAALQQQVSQLEARLQESHDSGAAAYNHMVHLGNLAAETIIANAYSRAEHITGTPAASSQLPAGADLGAEDETASASMAPQGGSLNEEGATQFHEAWKREATFDERFADQSFFDIEYDDASRRWILDESK